MSSEVVAAIIAAIASVVTTVVGAVITVRWRDKKREKDADVTVYRSVNDYISAFQSRIQRARRVDDVSWMQDTKEQWAGQDRTALRHLYETIDEVVRKPDIIWRDVIALSEGRKAHFEQYKQLMLEPYTPGYNLAYYKISSTTTPPLIGFSIVNSGEKNGEVFLVVNQMRLSVKQPDVVDYFSRYFELIWEQATKLKQGTVVDEAMLSALEVMMEEDQEEDGRRACASSRSY